MDRLIELSKSLPVHEISLNKIRELDEPYWYGNLKKDIPTVRSIFDHLKLVMLSDLSFPIVLSSDGRVMDGMHRVVKALLNGHETIKAVQFEIDPKPDHTDVDPEQLEYK